MHPDRRVRPLSSPPGPDLPGRRDGLGRPRARARDRGRAGSRARRGGRAGAAGRGPSPRPSAAAPPACRSGAPWPRRSRRRLRRPRRLHEPGGREGNVRSGRARCPRRHRNFGPHRGGLHRDRRGGARARRRGSRGRQLRPDRGAAGTVRRNGGAVPAALGDPGVLRGLQARRPERHGAAARRAPRRVRTPAGRGARRDRTRIKEARGATLAGTQATRAAARVRLLDRDPLRPAGRAPLDPPRFRLRSAGPTCGTLTRCAGSRASRACAGASTASSMLLSSDPQAAEWGSAAPCHPGHARFRPGPAGPTRRRLPSRSRRRSAAPAYRPAAASFALVARGEKGPALAAVGAGARGRARARGGGRAGRHHRHHQRRRRPALPHVAGPHRDLRRRARRSPRRFSTSRRSSPRRRAGAALAPPSTRATPRTASSSSTTPTRRRHGDRALPGRGRPGRRRPRQRASRC